MSLQFPKDLIKEALVTSPREAAGNLLAALPCDLVCILTIVEMVMVFIVSDFLAKVLFQTFLLRVPDLEKLSTFLGHCGTLIVS